MDPSHEQTLTDIDENVTLRVADSGAVTVEISPIGFRLPVDELARRIVETAERLPAPGDQDANVESSMAEIGQMRQVMATGGYEAFAEAMRRRLGIEGPPSALDKDPEHDRALAAHLDGVLNTMREASASRRQHAPEVLTAEAATDEGDLTVTSSSERTIAAVAIEPAARARGVDGLGQTLTALLAEARAALGDRSDQQIRDNLPGDLVATMDNASEDGERAGRAGSRIIDQAAQAVDSLKRRAAKE